MILINCSAIMIVFNNGSSANGHKTTQSDRQIGKLPKNNTKSVTDSHNDASYPSTMIKSLKSFSIYRRAETRFTKLFNKENHPEYLTFKSWSNINASTWTIKKKRKSKSE